MLRLVVGLALVALTVTSGCSGTPRATCPAIPAVQAGAPLLWRVSKAPDGPVVYLYGTIHDASIDDVPRAALDALASSRRFASELGDAEPDPDRFRELSRVARGPGIDTQLGDDWWDLRDLLRDRVREDDLRRARPWYALLLLNRRVAPRVVAMDATLAERAKARGIPVDGLEKPEDQIAALDQLVTVEDLRTAIRSRHALSCEYTTLVAAYRSSDLASLEPMLVIPRTAEVLLYARNRRWIAAIERYLTPEGGGAFIAVGLGHMLGDQGLTALLEKAGYRVTRVP